MTVVAELGAMTAPHRGARPVALWLFAIAVLIVAMVLVGGLTRLTDSGLSIVEWKPATGWIPPLSEAAWQAEFDKYKQFPEYQKINRGMDLAGFKSIFWLEFGHRVLGRVVGLVFAVPLAIFLFMGMIQRSLVPRLIAILVLGGTQGALGWWMVKSGLVDRPDVSPFRLAAHLGLAVLLYILVIRTALQLWQPVIATPAPATRAARVALVLTFIQILFGALVAGLDAGLIYNTWPLMDGRIAPLYLMGTYQPLWLDPFENVATAQFQHRMMAYVVVAAVAWLWWRAQGGQGRRWADVSLVAVLLQAGLGIATLLYVVPIGLAVLHQLGAVALITFLLACEHFSRTSACPAIR